MIQSYPMLINIHYLQILITLTISIQ